MSLTRGSWLNISAQILSILMNKNGDRNKRAEARKRRGHTYENSPLCRLLGRRRRRGADSHNGGLECPLGVPPLRRIGRLAGPRGGGHSAGAAGGLGNLTGPKIGLHNFEFGGSK
jgi:hypothetical protein